MARSRPSTRGRLGMYVVPCTIGLILHISLSAALRADPPRPGEYQVKAAFLYNFAKFVEWPADRAGKERDAIVIGVLGEDPFGLVLDSTFEGKSLADRRFEIRRYDRVEQLQQCHILFIGASEKRGLPKILGVVRGIPVLTVSDGESFVDAGGMIELLLEDNKIRFNINLQEAKRARLKISAPLLQLARRVEGN